MQSAEDGKLWYALHVKTRFEKVVARNLLFSIPLRPSNHGLFSRSDSASLLNMGPSPERKALS
jgi:hypothetical protein